MPDTIIESVLFGKLDRELLVKWINNESIEGAPEDCILLCCNRNEFVAYFLSYLRNQTNSILKTNTNALPILQNQSTPEKSFRQRKHQRSISDPTYENDRTDSVKSDKKTQESPCHERRKVGRRVKTRLFYSSSSNSKLYPDDRSKEHNHSSSDDSKLSVGLDRMVISSTPLKNGFKSDSQNLPSPVTPTSRSYKDYERCDTPRLSRHTPRSQEKSLSLADYLVNVPTKSSSKKKRQKNTSNEDSEKVDLDLSNSEIFPEIGARKSCSLKSECRRIKPTNIDKKQKSTSLNNFNESFQQPSLALEENIAFKSKLQPKESSNNFETERSILKQERHKLMEKFNILNTTTSPKQIPPPLKILQKESPLKQNFIDADISKVTNKENIDVLIEIYDVLLKNNLILSVNTEIYFLITILLSKQVESEYNAIKMQTNTCDNMLKSIHNSTYFSVKSLWNLRTILEVILDKNSLKILGENKKVRSFYPELAKFLLNSYGLKCEAETMDKCKAGNERVSNGIVCFNIETDNADNFPSVLSFQNFKKQRDMFYEILRWYEDNQSTGVSRSTFRARIKSLVACGQTAANHAHLAALFMHMLVDCLPPNEQESKLSKLQRRLTCATTTESHRLPHFTDKEIFYKEFIMYAENESFRVHLRDALSSEIVAMDAATIGNETSNNADISREFLQLSKKLGLLSKFLGYLTSLPYSQVSMDVLLKTGTLPSGNNQKEDHFVVPKEKILENDITLRNYSQPSLDLTGLLTSSYENGRLTITIPWIVHYLSMLDYTSLRIKYYRNLMKLLFFIYTHHLKPKTLKKNTIIFLKSILGWLFDLPHIPQEIFYEKCELSVSVASVVFDSSDLIDEFVLFELCPCLKDVNVLLSTSKVTQEKDGSFRHITPVMLSFNNEDRIMNKEKELQIRLEEEFIKSQPSSTRRVLELVIERVTSATVKDLTAHALTDARKKSRATAALMVANCRDKSNLLQSLESMYSEHLEQLRALALEQGPAMKCRVEAALEALVGGGQALAAAATRACRARLAAWVTHHWSSTAILCKNIEQDMTTLLSVGENSSPSPNTDLTTVLTCIDEFDTFESPAHTIITFKEHICQLLEYSDPPMPAGLLQACVSCCNSRNVFSRPPAQKLILQLSIDYCLVFLSRKPTQISDSFLSKLHNIWNTCCPDRKRHVPELELERRLDLSPTFRNFEDDRAPTPQSDEDTAEGPGKVKIAEVKVVEIKTPEGPQKPETDKAESNEFLECFDRILCPRNLVLLGQARAPPAEVWAALATVLLFLLNNDYLGEDSLTEQCLAVYRQDWPQNVLENLSTCMKSVSSRWSRSSSGKFTLFLDFLADYCGDMDFELAE